MTAVMDTPDAKWRWRFPADHAASRRAFTLIELLVTLSIIGILATVVTVAIGPARRTARDKTRVIQINELGRFLLAGGCYAPSGGAGDYDLKDLIDEYVAAHPEARQFLSQAPRDPSAQSGQSGFRYAYSADGHCALYANLEDPDTATTLPAMPGPTPGAGTGTLRASANGPNGSPVYYQVSN